MKTLTVLLGSPRRDGNTDTLAQAFSDPFTRAGSIVNIFRLDEMKLGGCTDCRMCWKAGKPCVFEDDMEGIYRSMDASDLIVFVTPLYWYSWSAQIKPVWDRLVPYNAGDAPRTLKGKQALLIAAGADDGSDIFDGLTASYRKSCDLLGLERAGEFLYPGLFGKHDAADRPELLAQIRAAGEKLL